jgi:asparagine synthase (glutamine-hydrolysing)
VIRQQRWWKPRTRPSRIGYAEGVERMHTEIDRAVRAHLATNAPVVAAQLSGGHDSSLVVASAAALIDPGKQVVAITGDGAGAKAELPADSFDEAEVAAETAAMLPNVTHLFARVDPESPLAATDRWFAGGQPMLNPFNLGWLDHSFDLAREAGAQVMLIGRAGNMTVSHWGSDLFPMLARSGRIQRLMREWRSYRRAFRPTPAGMLAMTFGPWIPGPLWNWLALRRGGEVEPFDERAFLRPQSSWARRALKIGRAQGLAVSAAPGRLFGGKLRWLELLWADPGPMNHWVRARHGIELRDPLASRRVMELSFQLGPDHFYRDGQGRRLSRTLLEGRVPERVTSEHRRGMQGVNWAASAELAREQMLVEVELIARDATLSALFDVERMRGMLESWPKDWSDADLSEQYRGFFSTAVCAARWARCVREPGRAAERR